MTSHDNSDLADLLRAAVEGDQSAWDALVERYLPLVYSVLRNYRLTGQDAADVSQTLWLRLVENLKTIREPRALPSWIITTTKREALRVLSTNQRALPVDPGTGFAAIVADGPENDEALLCAERRQALRDGLANLKPEEQQLMLLLIADPPVSYAEISRRLGIPVGSIGPTRGRCLDKLRETAGLERLLVSEGRRR
jgi:RNA polymerase sigma factor (sigma-70 family)